MDLQEKLEKMNYNDVIIKIKVGVFIMKDILKLVERYQHVIHTQDKDEFDELWSSLHECTLISITHEYRGVESIYQDFLIDGIQKSYTYIELINDGIEINMIRDDLAIVIFQYHTECIKRDLHEAYGIQGLETQIVIKEDGLWKLLHVHYSK